MVNDTALVVTDKNSQVLEVVAGLADLDELSVQPVSDPHQHVADLLL
jgi:hypothetical protein